MKERIYFPPSQEGRRAGAVAPGPTQSATPSPRLPSRLPWTALAPQPGCRALDPLSVLKEGAGRVVGNGQKPRPDTPLYLSPVRASPTPDLKANSLGR